MRNRDAYVVLENPRATRIEYASYERLDENNRQEHIRCRDPWTFYDVQPILVHGAHRDARNSFFATEIQRARRHQLISHRQGIRSDPPPVTREHFMVPADDDASKSVFDLVRRFWP